MQNKPQKTDKQKEVLGAGNSPKNAPQGEQTQKKRNWTKRQSPSLYLVLTIGPGGLKFSDIRFFERKPDPRDIAHGEGQCMVFKLNNWDASNNFADALFNGTFLNDMKDKIFDVDLTKNG